MLHQKQRETAPAGVGTHDFMPFSTLPKSVVEQPNSEFTKIMFKHTRPTDILQTLVIRMILTDACSDSGLYIYVCMYNKNKKAYYSIYSIFSWGFIGIYAQLPVLTNIFFRL